MPMPVPPAPAPPPRPTPRALLRDLRQVKPLPPGRRAFAVRAALAMGIPLLAGWWAGDQAAGAMATIGGFTALYCNTRPYAARAIALAAIACTLALAVVFGLWLEHWPWLVLPVMALFAMLSTWLTNAMRIGPPGAYIFLLACAAGTAMPAHHLAPWHAALLVFAGGALAWLLHMAGALANPRGPERNAVAAAGRAVADCIAAGPDAHAPRRLAAQTLHESWQTLVGFQPIPARRGGELERLRAINRQLHLLFADAIGGHAPQRSRAELRARADALIAEATQPAIQRPRALPPGSIPSGYPRSWTLLREGIAPGSNALRLVLRVGLAILLAGALAGFLDMQRAYWAMAAALLMLYQGFDWPRTLLRSVERTLGTWVGLLLAGAILWWHPTGPWLALLVMALQFLIEIIVVRNYALAAVFITGVALTLASGGHAVDDLRGLLLARGLDTLLGCACALLAFRLVPPRADARTITQGIAQCLSAMPDVCAALASGDVTTPAARAARRDLQHRSGQLEQRVDEAVAGSDAARRDAARWWPGVSICQRLVYRLLAACWDSERDPSSAEHAGRAHLRREELDCVLAALAAQSQAWHTLSMPPPLPPQPDLLQPDLADLRDFLAGQLD